jgi:hypothetical protein
MGSHLMGSSIMATASRKTAVSPEQILELAPVDVAGLSSVGETLLRLQRLQVETALAWIQAAVGMQQELWDEWVSHWGGGVPLDG